jgi:hypothetical protein
VTEFEDVVVVVVVDVDGDEVSTGSLTSDSKPET